MAGPLRSVVPIAVILLVTVIAAVAVALIASPDEPEQYPSGSPEGAVQRYLQAIQDREIDRAYNMLSSDAQEDMTPGDFRDRMRFNVPDDDVRRVRLDDVEINGDRATVRLTVERVTGSGIDFNRYSYQRIVPLVRENGDWKIDDPYTGIAFAGGADRTG